MAPSLTPLHGSCNLPLSAVSAPMGSGLVKGRGGSALGRGWVDYWVVVVAGS